MPADMLTELTPYFKHISQNKIKGKTATVLWLINKPFLVAASPVVETAKDIPASGYMYMLRSIDAPYIQHIQDATSTSFTLQSAVAKSKQIFVVKQSKDHSVKSWRVSVSPHNLPIQINVGGPTRLSQERNLSYWAVALSSTALILLSLAGIYLILNLRILRRLKDFSRLADRHRAERDPNLRWPVQGSDELDKLGTSLNDLMVEINARHQDLDYLADHDALTGVGNRRQLFKRLEAVQNRSRRQPSLTSSLLLLDLDGFKSINDELGHAIGDLTLKVVATRLLAQSRNYDTVARLDEDEGAAVSKGNQYVTRLGGDEFAVLLEDTEPSNALLYADRLLAKLNQPIELEGQSLIVRSSIGIAPVNPLLSIDIVMRNADLAMYEAKRRGKNQAVVFDSIIT